MSSKQQTATAIVALAMIGIYSWIMMASSGSAATWASLILLAAIALLVTAGRSLATARDRERDAG
ncbi:MAG: hypothetical protein OEX97_10520 [Acidimicrobiia bacterium]|nr:hypothetical protein [Acidimicrobiia bacterium]